MFAYGFGIFRIFFKFIDTLCRFDIIYIFFH